jgi:Pacifastin inhibitor (LCMII)
MREFKAAWTLGALVMLFALACGGHGIKTTPKADGQVTTCSYGGQRYNPGDSFRQDCNTCSCGGNGEVTCTLIACLTDAGKDLAPDAAPADADVAGRPDAAPEQDAPQVTDAATSSNTDTSSSTADASPGCTPPVVGAACTADEVACVACCTERWTCQGGAWQSGFIGCLPGLFSCGNLSCQQGTEYCEISGGDGGPTQYACQPLPSGCKGPRCPSCDCLTLAGISFSQCTANAGGSIWTTQ